MARKMLKFLGIGLVSLFLLALVFYLYASWRVENRLSKVYQLKAKDVPIPTDAEAIAHGQYILKTRGCEECHGEGMGGKVFLDDPALGRIVAVNVTKGKGGLPKDYSRADYLRALRHGIRKDGTPLLLMPSEEYTHLSDKDVSSLIAFLETLPAKDSELPKSELRFLGKILTHLDKIHLLSVEMIDHDKERPKEVLAEPTAAYGQYLATGCTGCHRPDMKGGPPIAPGFPEVPDVTSTGRVGKMTQEQFIHVLRTGESADGRKIDPKNMPWTMTKEYKEEELIALYKYLSSI